MRILLLSLGALLGPASAWADEDWPPSVSFDESFQLRYWIVDDRLPAFPDRPVFNYVEQVNRLTGQANAGDHSLFLQLDQVALLGNRYVLDGEVHTGRDLLSPEIQTPLPDDTLVHLEKLRYRWATRDHRVDLGDTYAVFGRGVALNLNRSVEIDVDTSIQGARSRHRWGSWELMALAGQLNRQTVFHDNPNVGLRRGRRHAVAGARLERSEGGLGLGGHTVAYDFVSRPGVAAGLSELEDGPDAVVGGGNVEAFDLGGLDVYLEANGFWHRSERLFDHGDPEPGYAVYGSVGAYVGPTSWLLEGMRGLNTQRINAVVGPELYNVAFGPTLEYERAVTEDSAATLASNDIWRGRVRMDLTLPAGVTPSLSMAVYRDEDMGPLHFNVVPETIFHPLAGVQILGASVSAFANLGYRVDVRDGTEHGMDRQLHGDVDVTFPLFFGLQGEAAVGAEHFRWGQNPFQQQDYFEVDSSVSVRHGSGTTLIGYVDYSDNPLIDSTGNLTEHLYGALELRYPVSPSWTVSGFYGAYKAGIRCAGGQCRVMPGFKGGRVAVRGSF